MAPHSNTLAWKIPWAEEPGRLQSMGSRRVRHDWVTSLSLSCIGEGNGTPLQCSCLENPRVGGAWWAAVYGVTQSWTRLKRMAPHSSTLAWIIPWTEDPGGLQSMGSLRVGHDWATSLSLSLSYIGEGNGNPLQCSCLENPRDDGAWWVAIYGVAQSQTRLKRLSSSSSSSPMITLSHLWNTWVFAFLFFPD